MWLGVAAGLALLTWSFPRPAYASNVSVNDQQLTYDGNGWQPGIGPQACSGISQTVHTTSTTGDFVTHNFTGNAIFVRGPLTTLSNPVIVILDGNIQPAAAPVTGSDGCGVIYSNTNIQTSLQEHMITLVFSAATGSVQFSISGITVSTPDNVMSAVASSTQSQVTVTPSPTVTATTTSSLLSTTDTDPTDTDTTAATATVANAAPLPPPASPTMSAVQTSAFVTTPGMTTALIGAIVGTIFAMLALLLLFILLRRRITLSTARKMDQENSFGRGVRELEEGNGKTPEEAGSVPIWSMGGKEGGLPQFVMETGPVGSFGQPMAVATLSPAVPMPAPVASGSGLRPNLSITTAYPQRSSFAAHTSPVTAYTVPLGAALLTRSPASDFGDDPYSPERVSLVPGSHRRTLSPLSIPIVFPRAPSISHSHSPTPPGLPTASTTNTLHSYPGATFGRDGQSREKGGPYVVNRSGSSGSSIATRKTSDPPPGYF